MNNLPAKNSYSYYFQVTDDKDDGLTKWLKSISFLSALLALLIFTDYFLPYKTEKQKIKSLIVRTGFSEIDYALYQKQRNRFGEEEHWLILNQEEVAISEEDIKKLKVGGEITLYTTQIFGINVKAKNNYISNYILPYFNVFGLLIIIPILLLAQYFLIRIFSKNTDVLLSIGVLNIIMLVGYGFLLMFY
jgi:hypothetical protein